MPDPPPQESQDSQEVTTQRKHSLGLALVAGFTLIIAGPFVAMFADAMFLDTSGYESGPGQSFMSPAGRLALAFLLPAGALAGAYCAATIAKREEFFVTLMLATGSGGIAAAIVFDEPYSFAAQVTIVSFSIGAAFLGAWFHNRRKSNQQL